MMRSRLVLLVVGIACLAFSAQAASWWPNWESGKTRDEAAARIEALLRSGERVTVEGVSVATAPLLAVYEARDFQPLWTKNGMLTRRGEDGIRVIAEAQREGLPPARYGIEGIRRLSANRAPRGERRVEQEAALDILVSHAITRYGYEVRYGATPVQRTIMPSLQDGLTSETQASVLAGATEAGDVSDFLEGRAPKLRDYRALRTGLALYRQIVAQGGWPTFPPGKKIAPGGRDARLPALRRILAITGDYSGGNAASTTYDSELVGAVKQFQRRHGITDDGTIGTLTQQALAVPARERVRQIVASMDRMRWMSPLPQEEKYILVNLAGQVLYARSGDEQLTMRDINGKHDTPTPLFSNVIASVVFNPIWGVPDKIAIHEMLPKIQADPGYLSRGGYTVVNRSGEEVDASSVNWSGLSAENFPYSIRQQPGDDNALGKIKFYLPDNQAIYLHSTSQPQLFAKDARALSHGCVRVEKPTELMHFVMDGNSDLSAEEIDAAYQSDAQRTVSLDNPIPVHTVYWTAWTEGGLIRFAPDVYGKDGPLLAALGGAI